MSSFALYVGGLVILLAGVVYAAVVLGVATQWVVAGALIVAGLGVIMGVATTRKKDDPEAP